MKEDKWFDLIREFIANAPKMDIEAQRAVATYIQYASQPVMTIKTPTVFEALPQATNNG